jgi:aldehyde dehydrogenase (NAD+)/phenylacetaldehyde dehydrogenase
MTRSSTLESEFLSSDVRGWLEQPKKLLIGGRWLESTDGRTFDVIDPATGGILTTVAEAGAHDADLAVKAARRALDTTWANTTPAERGRLIWKLADLIEQHAEEFQHLESLDVGKPVMETLVFDVPVAVDHFRYFAGWATKISGELLSPSLPGEQLAYTRREPVGVVVAITPWNFPLAIASWKLAPALACGNTVILKPSELTPLSALRLGELILDAGFPPGVVNILPGPGTTVGAALVHHQGVDKISFTGSTRVGREIMTSSAHDFKRITLELGGKSPNIILPDADLDAAAGGAMSAIFFNQGEACAAGSRLFVQHDQFFEVTERLRSRATDIVQGVGLDPMTQMGPLVSETHMDRVLGYIARGLDEGAEIITGGERNPDLDGFFVRPTIFSGRDDHAISREEIFGPVLTVLPYTDIDDLIRRANDTVYGLAASVWTQDLRQGIRVAHALKAGSVWVNGFGMVDATLPWGGFKQSGVGREMGKYALDTYTEVKTVWVNLL